MGRLQTVAAECKHREYYRLLTGLCIGGLDDEGLTDEILREVAMQEDIEEATSDCIFTWACRVKVQRAKSIVLDSIKEAKGFDAIQQNARNCECEIMHSAKCRYCRTGHPAKQWPAYGKKCR